MKVRFIQNNWKNKLYNPHTKRGQLFFIKKMQNIYDELNIELL